MAAIRAPLKGNQSSSTYLPLQEPPRRAGLECKAARSRACADLNLVQRSRDLADPVHDPIDGAAKHSVRLEVGRAVDISEQVRRLEANWNHDESDLSSDIPEMPECSGRHDTRDNSASPKQQWQMMSRRRYGSLRRRARRKRLGGMSKAGGSLHADIHLPRPGQRDSTAGSSRTESLTTKQSCTPHSQEEADAMFLSKFQQQLDVKPAHRDAPSALMGVFGGLVLDGLLSRQEEHELGRIVQAGLEAERLLDEASAPSSSLSTDAADTNPTEVLQKRLASGEAAQWVLLRSNLKLVSSVARGFEGKGLELADLIVDGVTGLSRAIKLFDPSKGLKFSTYAYMWIRQAIGRSIIENGRIVRLPSHIVDHVNQVGKTRQRLAARDPHSSPTDLQIAQTLGLTEEKVALYTQLSRTHFSLEDPADSTALGGVVGEEDSLADAIQDQTPTAEDLITQEEGQVMLRKDLESVLEGLSIRERNILRFRYGMHTEPLSLKDLSLRYGMSMERVRQIGENALGKLQARQAAQGKPQEGRTNPTPYLRPELYALEAVD